MAWLLVNSGNTLAPEVVADRGGEAIKNKQAYLLGNKQEYS